MSASARPPQAADALFRFPLLGQERVVRLLTALLQSRTFPPLLFAGPEGTGKRTAALLLAQAANCSEEGTRPCGTCRSCRTIATLRHPDIRLVVPLDSGRAQEETSTEESLESIAQSLLTAAGSYGLSQIQPEPDPRQRISIGAIRWVRREMARPPLFAPHRFFIVVRADRMGVEAANAFLKTLEEPQAETCLILTTDRPELLLDTIRSRCRLVRFSPLKAETVQDWLMRTRRISAEEAELAAVFSEGAPGRAIRFLDDPDKFLCTPALNYFSLGTRDQAAVLSAINELGRTPLETIVLTLLFLYRQALLYKLGIPGVCSLRNAAIKAKAERCSLETLEQTIVFLTSRLQDCRLPVNRPLFLYTLLSGLRKS